MQISTYNRALSIREMSDPINPQAISALIESIAAANSLDEATAAVETLFRPYVQAGADLAHDVINDYETGGQAGTTAYDMLSAYASAEAATTEALIGLVAATVLAKLIEEEGGGRSNISFTPQDMDATFRDYHVDHSHEGIITKVSLSPKTDRHERLMTQDEDTTKALPQAEPKPERPVWAVRMFGKDGLPYLRECNDRFHAETILGVVDQPASIENRMCIHPECPSDRCNLRS